MKYFPTTKFITVFFVTFLLSLSFHGYFGRYTFSYSVEKTFTKKEVGDLSGKRVSTICFRNISEGTISGFDKNRGIEMTYDKPISGKFPKLYLDKQTFEKCLNVIDLNVIE